MIARPSRWPLPALLALASFAFAATRASANSDRSQTAVGAVAVAVPTPTGTPSSERPLRLRVPVNPADHSFHEVAAALAQAARSNSDAGELFQFDAQLGEYAGDASSQRALRDYLANARFGLPNNGLKYIDTQWMLPDASLPNLPDRGAWVREDDLASIVAQGDPEAAHPEPAGLHPALRGWRIDRAGIARAVAAHSDLFRGGLMSVTVTSAIRARTPEKVFGVTGADKSAALRGLAVNQAVVAIVGASHPCDVIHPGEYWAGYLCGNYLIIDGAGGGELAAGAYHEFHQSD